MNYSDIVSDLERKVATGQANYLERQMAASIGIEPVHTSYKDRGTTYRAFKAVNVDTGKLTRLVDLLKNLGVDLTGFIGSATPEKQMEGLINAIGDWLEKARPATSMGNSKGTGGAGANPPKNPAAQKAQAQPWYSNITNTWPPRQQAGSQITTTPPPPADQGQDKAWQKTLEQLASRPPWATRPGPGK